MCFGTILQANILLLLDGTRRNPKILRTIFVDLHWFQCGSRYREPNQWRFGYLTWTGFQCTFCNQGCGSGSGFNRVYGSGSGSRRAKMTHKSRKKLFMFMFMFWSVGWPILRAEGFFYNLDILYKGLGIGKLQFLLKKYIYFFLL